MKPPVNFRHRIAHVEVFAIFSILNRFLGTLDTGYLLILGVAGMPTDAMVARIHDHAPVDQEIEATAHVETEIMDTGVGIMGTEAGTTDIVDRKY